MSENKDRKIITAKGGVFNDLVMRIKLIIRLMGDPRVNPLLKLLPVGALVYFIMPDLVIGPIDDVAVMWLGAYLFIELCPPEIVQEHMQAINQVIPGTWENPKEMAEKEMDGEVIEGEYWEKKE
jgi:uncharacterized membrane protein YkvA (DUF1232 family)